MLPVIPVRGGSRGVYEKWNIKVDGKSLLEWTIDLAKRLSTGVVRIKIADPVVLARDPDVVNYLRNNHRYHLVRRSWSHDLDDASTRDLLRHDAERFEFDVLLLLQPTVTKCPAWVADRAIGAVLEGGYHSAVSVVDIGERHPARMYWANGEPVLGGSFKPRQQLAPAYLRDGAVYAISRKQLLEGDSLLGHRPYLVKRHWSETWNIDHPADLKIAEALCATNE